MFKSLVILFTLTWIMVCNHMKLSLSLRIYYSYILFIYIPFIGINHNINMVSDETATWKISILLRCKCSCIYVTENSSYDTDVENIALSSSLKAIIILFYLENSIQNFIIIPPFPPKDNHPPGKRVLQKNY